MKKLFTILSFFILFSSINLYSKSDTAKCVWKNQISNFYAWDSCQGNGGHNSLNAYISIKRNCLKYIWTINGVTQTTKNYYINHAVTANGTYSLCVKVIDTCNNCDTTLCSSRSITCFSNCNWKGKSSNFYALDTCQGKGGVNSINGYYNIKNATCLKYVWSVNGVTQSTKNPYINYRITGNGTYSLCVKIYDTCNKCDTTYCSTRNITCFSKCIWKSKSPSITSFDTCQGKGGRNSMNAYLGISSRTCLKYIWSVNGVTQSTDKYYINYPITANGTYNLCVKVIDTCNKCDTTLCSTRTFTCFPACNWKSKISNFYAWDTCTGNSGRNSVNAYIAFNTKGCYKYEWTVGKGGITGTGNVMHYNIYNNGTYTICVKVTDTCSHCDTTICSTRTITCFNSSKCNFKARTPYFFAWDTCKGNGGANSINAYISFQSFYCFKYVWSVNGVTQSSTNFLLHYPIKANGTYVVCVKVIDSCNNCDTTICTTRGITCFSSCNWKSKTPVLYNFDTCQGNGGPNSLNSYLAISSRTCQKYVWTVNGAVQPTKNYYLHYPVSKNGTYVLCLKVIDTCNKCDTTFCSTRTVTCFPSCNWKANSPYFFAWDTCKGTGGVNSINAYISIKNSNCNKYQWMVNGLPAGRTNVMHHAITQNGTYNICVKVTDTCKKCDTTFCAIKTITCFSSCDFKARTPYFNAWDSCLSNKSSINGYITFYNRNCMKYLWTLNGDTVGNGNRLISVPVYKNGNYTLCVKVTDTCNNCDTTICLTRTLSCKNLNINSTSYNSNITLYPNPAGNIININWTSTVSNNNKVSYQVYDVIGNLISSGTINNGENQISSVNWNNGMYLIKVQTMEGDKILKVVINR